MKQSSKWLYATLGHKRIESLMMRIHRMLLHKFPLTYSIDKGSTHLLKISRAAVPPHPPQQQLLQLLLHHFKGSTWSLSLNNKKLKVQKKNKEVLRI